MAREKPPIYKLYDAITDYLNRDRELAAALEAYEKTGDHNHGPRSLKPGEPCPGGDCLVHKARTLLGI